MSQPTRPTTTENGIPIVQPASSTPTPRPNVRRVVPAVATQPTVSLAEHEALKRRLDATEAMVNALVHYAAECLQNVTISSIWRYDGDQMVTQLTNSSSLFSNMKRLYSSVDFVDRIQEYQQQQYNHLSIPKQQQQQYNYLLSIPKQQQQLLFGPRYS
ncbi:hypothetical protein G6F56_011921 [Rhizopus delemar]|nr:hypothetical protein G6F56_011921 [Rhizopus delemar]